MIVEVPIVNIFVVFDIKSFDWNSVIHLFASIVIGCCYIIGIDSRRKLDANGVRV